MAKDEKTIKQNLAKFEEIISWFDGDDIDIEKSIAKYDEGAKLAEEIKTQLKTEKNRIKVLSQKFDD
jgi:Exonuclease VII small subunit.